MTHRGHVRLTALALLSLALLPAVAFAQQSWAEQEEARLTQLYGAWIRTGKRDEYLQKKIDVEREKIRANVDDEINTLVNSLLHSGTGAVTISESYDQEKKLVTALQTREDETKVDLSLLQAEEQRTYLSPNAGSGSVEYRQTTSYEELLAKRAILQERQQSVGFFLSLHEDRLRRLSFQQQIDQFTAFLGIGKYLFIVLGWVLIERFLRSTLFLRVHNRNRRYRLRKWFSGVMYGVLAIWIISQLFTEYPWIVTSFAIIGAGVAVALQDLIKNMIGWALVVQKNLFSLGDRIAVGEYIGDVIDIAFLHTTLLEVASTEWEDASRSAQPISIPNSWFLTRPVMNFSSTSDFTEAEIIVTLEPDADWHKADEILREILESETKDFADKARRQTASRTEHFYFSHEAKGARVFMDLSEQGIRFMLRFPVPIGERRFVVTKLTGMILDAFAKAKPPLTVVVKKG